MLLLQPLTELARFLPALIPLLLFGTASGFGPWAVIGVVAPLAFGVARYLTTEYRISDGRIELRRGVLQRRTTSARLERVRTVDMTATLGQRVLGVAKLVVGTGGAGDEDDRLELDGLARDRATAMRSGLLGRRTGVGRPGPIDSRTVGTGPGDAVPPVAAAPPGWWPGSPRAGCCMRRSPPPGSSPRRPWSVSSARRSPPPRSRSASTTATCRGSTRSWSRWWSAWCWSARRH
ncbi:PH domain-containing protein [Nocardioides sambongensis]|uniref:PH domain-containing protein n=1 Tax=Nocardioides sambongensis TaxID=2589074 RepID=UPI00112EE956|nr:PH domain-containing protein [Nocardioides sambongensis]